MFKCCIEANSFAYSNKYSSKNYVFAKIFFKIKLMLGNETTYCIKNLLPPFSLKSKINHYQYIKQFAKNIYYLKSFFWKEIEEF